MAYTDYGVECSGLRKSFGKLTVLDGLDLRVKTGSVFALLGPNGAGKTTTVRILSTLLPADGGSAVVAGHDVAREPAKVRRLISLTGQSVAVDDLLTGEENLLMMARLRHLGRASARLRTQQLLEQFDLVEARTRKVSSYSGGMRRRLDLAVSLISAPPVLFLDEPTTGLDPRSRRAMWDAVSRLSDSGVTVLLTTQYLEEADQLADRIAVIDDGRVVAEGTADELKSRVGSETVEMFFAESSALSQAAEAVSWNATVRADADRLSLSVPTDGSAAGVKQLLDLMDLRNIVVQRLALHRPTLDEVFLTLTGQKGLQHV